MAQAKTFNDNELKIVLAVVATGRNPLRNRIMILLSHLAGMRVGEIAAVKIGDVLNSNGSVRHEVPLLPDQTKGSKGRVVTLSNRLRAEIATYIQSLKHPYPDKPLIYSQKSRHGFSPNSLAQEFKTIYARAGIAGASSHSGRRTFITRLASKGVGVRVLAALAGHSSIATTQGYIDINDDMKVAAVNLL
jgi:integrase/recombinase XerD